MWLHIATNRSKKLQSRCKQVWLGYRRAKVILQFTPSFHFHLHGATSLERRSAPNDERQIVRSQSRIAVRRLGIGKSCTSEYGAALNAGLEALLAQG